jgi:hypothetical protein
MATTVSNASELINAVESAGAGDEIVAQGGTYDMSSQWTIRSGGEAGNPLVIRAADGETPTVKFAAGGSPDSDSGIQFRSPYVTFRGFEVSGSGWKGVNTDGNAHDVVLENLAVHGGNLWGIMNNGCDNVVFRNCDSYDNYDGQNDGDNSDGFNMTGPATNGLIEGCRAWNNGDDGYDFWVSEGHTIRYCAAWNNGRGSGGDGNGFKLGGGPNEGGNHLVHHCVSYNNRYRGFDWNTTDNPLEVYNCTAVSNDINYRFSEDGDYTLRNNISKDGDVQVASGVDDQNNSWDLGITPAFASTEPGSSDFMALADGDEAIDAGVDLGFDFNGDAPNLGAVKTDSSTDSGGGGSTSRITVDGSTKLAASAGSTDSDSKLSSHHTGYTDNGYVNFIPNSGGQLYWPLEVTSADTYAYEIRYAHGGDAERTVELNFAGTTQQLTFPTTGGWDQWEVLTGTIDLPADNVDLLIETIGDDGGNVDKLTLWPEESTDDGGDTSGDTANHGYQTPEEGTSDWHKPLNSNFEKIDKDVPIADAVGVRDEYTPAEGALYFATDTGDVYVGNGSEWTLIGSLN